jgi:hypothetical protein
MCATPLAPLERPAAAGIIERRATVFARQRGLGVRLATIADAFTRFFLAAARIAYPDGGFSPLRDFAYGRRIDLTAPEGKPALPN